MRQATEQATCVLRADILTGVIPSGTRLGEVELAERLAVSRTPVREALSRLAAEGLVQLQPNRGARVTTWSRADLREIFEARLLLEPYAVREAVPRMTADAIEEVDELAAAMLRAGRPGEHQDLGAVAELNRRFHWVFIEAADNAAVAAALRAVSHAAEIEYSAKAMARSLAHHVEMVAATRAGDAEWAEAIMRAHLHNARHTMLGGEA